MRNKNKLKELHEEFMKEHNVSAYSNGCGIGIDLDSKPECSEDDLGFICYFETKKDMESFPFKDTHYKGIPVFKKVIGKIVAAC